MCIALSLKSAFWYGLIFLVRHKFKTGRFYSRRSLFQEATNRNKGNSSVLHSLHCYIKIINIGLLCFICLNRAV